MGKRRQQQKALAKANHHSRRLTVVLVLSTLCLVVGGLFWGSSRNATSNPPPETLAELLKLNEKELAKCDIARMNLLCATALFGSENLDISTCLRTLDEWAAHVKSETDRNLHRYWENPVLFQNSEGLFRMRMLDTVLKQDFGVHYDRSHPVDEPTNTFFANSEHLFIHGLLGQKRAGTCGSIPVLVVSVARRLGYPVYLVSTRAHAFARWDDGKEQFNIEASNSGGMVVHPDAYYRQWPRSVTAEMTAAEGYFKSMSPKEELACFLGTRAICLSVNGRKEETKKICQKALELIPSSQLFKLKSEGGSL